MNLQPVITIGGQELRPGYRSLQITNSDEIRFQYFAVCDAVSPQRWHVEVVLFGAVILTTSALPTRDQALREAEAAVRQRLAHLFSA